MLKRRTFHECATRLEAVSAVFRSAYLNNYGREESQRQSDLHASSRNGIELLRILALSARGDMDYGKTENGSSTVGLLREGASDAEIKTALSSNEKPGKEIEGFSPLNLREALNKIAHPNPDESSFFVDQNSHYLILTGKRTNGKKWIAIVSIPELCKAIKELPDQNTRE